MQKPKIYLLTFLNDSTEIVTEDQLKTYMQPYHDRGELPQFTAKEIPRMQIGSVNKVYSKPKPPAANQTNMF